MLSRSHFVPLKEDDWPCKSSEMDRIISRIKTRGYRGWLGDGGGGVLRQNSPKEPCPSSGQNPVLKGYV